MSRDASPLTKQVQVRRNLTIIASLLLLAAVVASGLFSSAHGGLPDPSRDVSGQTLDMVMAAEPFDPEVVLPGRVDAALHRTYDAVRRAVAAVDDRRRPAARRAFRAVRLNVERSHKAVLNQVAAPQDPEAEDATTAGPDSALAGLNVEQASIVVLAGLFDRVIAPGVNQAISRGLAAAQVQRATLLDWVVGMDPEVEGAAYADALADTVPAYEDEVAVIQEALRDDILTPVARQALTAALERSAAAAVAVAAAYGGAD
jgi:hypothetical protein